MQKFRLLFNLLAKDMSKQDWIEAWKDNPHWSDSKEPSKGAIHFAERVRKFIADDVRPIRLLEIGCGNGRDSIYFGKQGFEVEAIDISADAITLARQLNVLPNVRFSIGDAEKLKFASNAFDAVYSWSVLHSTNLDLSLKEVARVLKLRGLVALYLYLKTDYYTPTNEFDRTETNFKLDEFKSLLNENNFNVEEPFTFLTSKDEDENGSHVHHIVICQLSLGE